MKTAVKSLTKAGEVVGELLRSIASPGAAIDIRETNMDGFVTISVFSSAKDYGRLVGAEAKNFWAFFALVRIMGAREQNEIQLNLVPPANREAPKHERFKPNPNWGKAQMMPLVKNVCAALFESGGVIDIVEPDPLGIVVHIKVNADEEENLSVIENGAYVKRIRDRDPDTGIDMNSDVTLGLVEQKLRLILGAISKNNGRTLNLKLTPIHYPNGNK